MLENTLQDRRPSIARSVRNRSAVTNRKRLFVEGDGRSPWARRWRDLIELHAGDLGGIDVLSEAQFSLIKRAATIEVELELSEGRMSMGEEVDLDIFTRSVSHLRRILETLGIERRPRDVTPTLREYLAAVQTAAAGDEEHAHGLRAHCVRPSNEQPVSHEQGRRHT
jgi:hypothetical protein